MDEMYKMSQSLHIYSVIGLIIILLVMLLMHKTKGDFKGFTKKINILMIFHITLASAVVLTGTIMMAVKHLSLTPANLLMIVSIFIISALEIKRNKALAKVIKYKQMNEEVYKKVGLKYQTIEFILLLIVGAFSGMANAVSF